MTLQNICDLFDSYYIADKQDELLTNYTSSSSMIFTDGTYDDYVGSDGNIHISNLSTGSTYICFKDEYNKIFISIYKYIYDGKFKDIISALNKLRETTGIKRIGSDDLEDHFTPNKLIDINTFKCPDCNSNMIWAKASKTSDTIVAYCNKCDMEYALVPSRYYIIKAKKKLYSDNSNSRNKIKELGGNKNGDNQD